MTGLAPASGPVESADEARQSVERALARRLHRVHLDLDAYLADNREFVIAVSGGPDSLALLDICATWAARAGRVPVVAHLDHAWRADSADDAAFVAGEAARRGVRCVIERLVEPRITEEAGRNARLEFLGRVARAHSTTAILMGHTRDDQVETVLQRLIRGSGATGATGMRAVTVHQVQGDDLRIIRPLLGWTHRETVSYCALWNLTPLFDQSNRSDRFLRNRIRHEVIPVLRRVAPHAERTIARFGDLIGESADVERDLARELLAKLIIARHEAGLDLDRRALRELSVAGRRILIRAAIQALSGRNQDLSRERLDEAARAIDRDASGARTHQLGRGIGVRIEPSIVVVRLDRTCAAD